MSFADKLKRMFFNIEEDEKESSSKNEETVEKEDIPEATPLPQAPMATRSSSGETNEEILKSFSNALEKANLEGFDYFEFAQIMEKLRDKMPSEEARYQAAFTSGSVMGATKEKLVTTAKHYLDVLRKEAEKFDAFYQEQVKRSVTDKEASLVEMNKSIQDKRSQIESLEQEINEASKAISAVNAEIIENKAKAEKVQSDFLATLNVFVSKINGDVEKINKYITE